ncbi:multiple monosaccharide ABC transporter ATP-binding protein [Robinsoniella peoriensis]|uniref:Xylose import ATP-binding protein XylG n=1 Tax=Robinsoniella peoriensis TaxID=180332 RepID=A0A4V6HR91_9FIRM|nr:multiple monosaccharide ABC transporter ATP-binding protein [Robinsoniella peoriensis]MDU7028759.1 multiple monosaccharide ABC transporter ATP-binding protein [Clostridiales bacterium]TLC98127.1 Xylose import ATP-binding protein XylG [Robinsoniella peoriensis]
MEHVILEMQNIIKEFPGVKALDHVNLKVRTKTIHALVGENGAGKSTLMKVLSGVYGFGTYNGKILYEGNECRFKNVKDSEREGIVIIHQELALIPQLSIMENIFMGNEQKRQGRIDWYKTRFEALKLMEVVGLKENPERLVNQIGVGKQQLVEIAKALSKKVKLLILDEPTAALNEDDSEKLLQLIMKLKEEHGMTSIIISHKLPEVRKVADDITVLRDGMTVETLSKESGEITEDRIIRGMVGRELKDLYPKRSNPIGGVRFEIKDWTVHSPEYKDTVVIDHVNIKIREGEVVGIAGLMGAGRTEFAMSLFGRMYGSNISGTVRKDNKEIETKNVTGAMQNGIAYLTEDRKALGLLLYDDIRKNISLPSLKKLSTKGVINENEEVRVAEEYMKKMSIKAPGISQQTNHLSGGNQQKVLLARLIYANPELLILDEPTRGIDVGAKYEIYTIINELAAQGKCIIVISSELPEVLGISDRIYVMNEGRIIGEYDKNDASQEKIMRIIVQSDRRTENE